jgi:hypothetical protein
MSATTLTPAPPLKLSERLPRFLQLLAGQVPDAQLAFTARSPQGIGVDRFFVPCDSLGARTWLPKPVYSALKLGWSLEVSPVLQRIDGTPVALAALPLAWMFEREYIAGAWHWPDRAGLIGQLEAAEDSPAVVIDAIASVTALWVLPAPLALTTAADQAAALQTLARLAERFSLAPAPSLEALPTIPVPGSLARHAAPYDQVVDFARLDPTRTFTLNPEAVAKPATKRSSRS